MKTPEDYARLFGEGLARRIHQLRREKGLSLYALAKLAGAKLDTVARIERGLHRLRVTAAALIFHALGRKLGDEMYTLEQEIFGDSGAAPVYSPIQDERSPRHPCFDSG